MSHQSKSIFSAFLIGALALFLTVPWLGAKEFSSRGEPREALVAQSMLNSGSYVVGTGYSGVVPSKPPMLHWLIVLSTKVGGAMDEFAARLPSSLASAVIVFFFVLILLREQPLSQVVLSSIVLLSSFEWLRASTTSRVDMVLAAAQCGALLAFFCWFQRPRASYWALSVLVLTIATLTKGPVAPVINGAIIALFLILRGCRVSGALIRGAAFTIPALLLALPWYLLALSTQGDSFLERFLYENVSRFSGTMEDSPHNHSALYLYGMFFLGLLPWSLFALIGHFGTTGLPSIAKGKALWSRLDTQFGGPTLKNRITRILELTSTVTPIVVLAWSAVLVEIVFFSIPESKRGVYLLPIYPWCAMLLGGFLYNCRAIWPKLLLWISAICSTVITALFLTPSLFGQNAPKWIEILRIARTDLSVFEIALMLGLIASCIYSFKSQIAERLNPQMDWDWIKLTLPFLMLLAVLQGVTIPAISNPLSDLRSTNELASKFPELIMKTTPLYSFDNEFYGVSFYLNREVKRVETDPPAKGALILALESSSARLSDSLSKSGTVELLHCNQITFNSLNKRLCLFKLQ